MKILFSLTIFFTFALIGCFLELVWWGDNRLSLACGVLGKITAESPRCSTLKMKLWFTSRKGNSAHLHHCFPDSSSQLSTSFAPSPPSLAILRECRKCKQLLALLQSYLLTLIFQKSFIFLKFN